jgi:uncharacterized protein with GYD domain
MPKYLARAKFTADGMKGLRAAGAVSRRKMGDEIAQALGGTQEAYYFAFGEWDAYSIMDLPNDEAMAALSTAANQAGLAQIEIVKLLTPEQLDEAFKVDVGYRPPGQ